MGEGDEDVADSVLSSGSVREVSAAASASSVAVAALASRRPAGGFVILERGEEAEVILARHRHRKGGYCKLTGSGTVELPNTASSLGRTATRMERRREDEGEDMIYLFI